MGRPAGATNNKHKRWPTAINTEMSAVAWGGTRSEQKKVPACKEREYLDVALLRIAEPTHNKHRGWPTTGKHKDSGNGAASGGG